MGFMPRRGAETCWPLHGDLSTIICLTCGHREGRASLDIRLDAANPGYLARLAGTDLRVNPDGDVELDNDFIRDFVMIGCIACGSQRLKPDVVYFGESVPAERKERLRHMLLIRLLCWWLVRRWR